MKNKNKIKVIIISAVGIILVILIVVFFLLKENNSKGTSQNSIVENSSLVSDESSDEETSKGNAILGSEVDETNSSMDYYKEIADKIIRTCPVQDSEDVKTEDEVLDTFSDRGFGDIDITSDISIDGELTDETTVTDNSDSKHPTYITYYYSENGTVWVIYMIEDCILANPFSYNAELEDGTLVMLSEQESVTSYDIDTNCFFEIVPNADTMDLRQVDRIDSSTLDSYTLD